MKVNVGDRVVLDVTSQVPEEGSYKGPGSVMDVFPSACLVDVGDGEPWWVPRCQWGVNLQVRDV